MTLHPTPSEGFEPDDGADEPDAIVGPPIWSYPIESKSRRADWTQGHPVVMADGMTWYLPVIDVPLLLTQPALAREFTRYLDMIRSYPDDIVYGPDEWNRAIPILYAMGSLLIRANYDLEYCCRYASLLCTFDLGKRDDIALVVSGVLPEVIADWECYISSSEPGQGIRFHAN